VSTVLERPQFRSVDAALRFYCDANTAAYELSSPELIGGDKPEGNGLCGLDGAGTRGIIGANLATLAQLWRRILLAKYTRAEVPCICFRSCCSKFKLNPPWAIEIIWISETIMLDLSATLLRQKPYLRQDIVERYFGRKHNARKLTNKEIATRSSVSERTVASFTADVAIRLRIEEQRGYAAIDERLRSAKVVG
jgi:hypothetical protein